MNPDDLIKELAAGLRGALEELPTRADDTQEAFEDLASRLVLRLAPRLTVVPTLEQPFSEAAMARGAKQALDYLTKWLIENQSRVCSVRRYGPEITVVVTEGRVTHADSRTFRGGSVQDAYAAATFALASAGGDINALDQEST